MAAATAAAAASAATGSGSASSGVIGDRAAAESALASQLAASGIDRAYGALLCRQFAARFKTDATYLAETGGGDEPPAAAARRRFPHVRDAVSGALFATATAVPPTA